MELKPIAPKPAVSSQTTPTDPAAAGERGSAPRRDGKRRERIVVVGGGSAGVAVAASLLRRRANLDITIIEPSETHSYQPGWTMVGAGIFTRRQTQRPMASVMPKRVHWLKSAAAGFAMRSCSKTAAVSTTAS